MFSAKTEEKQYKIEQKQRYLERGVRHWRIKAAEYKGLDDEAYKKARQKAEAWTKRYQEYSIQNKRAWDPERIHIDKINNSSKNILPDSVIIEPSKESFVRNVLKNPFCITNAQFGKKIGRHWQDYGLDPSVPDNRTFIRKEIHNIVNNCEEITCGFWRGQKNDVIFYIKGNDAVIANDKNEFVSILKDGAINNERIKDYRYRKV